MYLSCKLQIQCNSYQILMSFFTEIEKKILNLVSVQSVSRFLLFATPWTIAHQASLSITNSQSLLKFMSIESVMPYNHLILCCPLLLLPSVFPSIRVFSNKSAPCIKWLKCWSFSFSLSPFTDYSGLTSFRIASLISLQSKGLLRVLSNTTVQKHQRFHTQLSLWSNSHSGTLWSTSHQGCPKSGKNKRHFKEAAPPGGGTGSLRGGPGSLRKIQWEVPSRCR